MKRKFNPPPGWPTPPADWLPPNGWKPDSGWPSAPPGWQFWVEEANPKDVARCVAILVVLAAFTYAFPLYGLPVSLCLPVLTFNFRQYLWRGGVTRRLSLFCAMLAWVGLWWPAAVGLLTGWSPGASEPGFHGLVAHAAVCPGLAGCDCASCVDCAACAGRHRRVHSRSGVIRRRSATVVLGGGRLGCTVGPPPRVDGVSPQVRLLIQVPHV